MTDKLEGIGLIIVIMFLAISILINSSKSCDVNIDYDVTTNINSTRPAIAEVKLACYKVCIETLHDTSLTKTCLNKCEQLE